MQSRWRGRVTPNLAMGLFPHSFVDLEEVPLITPKLTLIIPRRDVRFTFRQSA